MISFKVIKLDIMQSYFFGKVEFRGDEYKVNIQPQKRGKIFKLPFDLVTEKGNRIVRLTGKDDLVVEDYLSFQGKSEWLEIDSDEITYFLADNQDNLDTIEIAD